ncbi:hypothetical protein JHK86_050046 [Glycine max]|nr:hypothetical protein JHK86_050046 [Glycine max]
MTVLCKELEGIFSSRVELLNSDHYAICRVSQCFSKKWEKNSRFLLKLSEKAKPFYKLLKKTKPLLWDKTCEQAFLAFKKTIITSQV